MDTTLRYTSAPRALDLPGTEESGPTAGTDTAGAVWRAVNIPSARLDEQAAAYRSGSFATMPGRDFLRAVRDGIVRRADITHERTGSDATLYRTVFTDDKARAAAYRAAGLASGATFARIFDDSVIAAYRVAIHFPPGKGPRGTGAEVGADKLAARLTAVRAVTS